MFLNAAKRVAPDPAPPNYGASLYAEMGWTWNGPPQPLQTDYAPIPPLSRLLRRAFVGPAIEPVILNSSLAETMALAGPISHWELRLTTPWNEMVPWAHPQGQSATVYDGRTQPDKRMHAIFVIYGEAYYKMLQTPGAQLWAQRPRHFRAEIGHPIPFDEVDKG